MSSGQAVSNLIVVVIVFFFAAFFVAAEFAIVSVRKSQIESMLEDGEGNKKKLEMALKMVDNMNEYLSTTQVGVSLTGIILGWLGADTLSQIFADFFGFTPLNHTTIMAISAVLGVVLLTYLEVVLTEIVPKNISIDMPMKVMMFVVRPLHYFHILFYPFVWLLNASANGIVKAMGLKPAGEDTDVLSENEILNLSKNAVTGGSIDKEDYLYMRRAFEFNDKVVKDVLNKYLQEKHSRYPVVANNDKDKILGYVYIYDLIRQSRVDDTIKISKLLRTIISVPETTELQGLLRQMTRKRVPMVVVLDEYGGTSGIVTDRDIYEEVFGTVLDEADDVLPDDIIDNHNGTYKVSGKTTLYDFERYFGFQEKDFLESESVTLAGYLQDNYKIQLGTEVELGGLKVKVTEFNRNYVDWVEVCEMKK